MALGSYVPLLMKLSLTAGILSEALVIKFIWIPNRGAAYLNGKYILAVFR